WASNNSLRVREADLDPQPTVGARHRGQAGAMSIGDRSDDREAEPEPRRVCLLASAVQPPERLRKLRGLFGRDHRSRVLDLDRRLAVPYAGPSFDPAVAVVVLDRFV